MQSVRVSKSDRERFARSLDEWFKTTFVMVALGAVGLVLVVSGAPRWLLFAWVAVMAVVGTVRVGVGLRRIHRRSGGS